MFKWLCIELFHDNFHIFHLWCMFQAEWLICCQPNNDTTRFKKRCFSKVLPSIKSLWELCFLEENECHLDLTKYWKFLISCVRFKGLNTRSKWKSWSRYHDLRIFQNKQNFFEIRYKKKDYFLQVKQSAETAFKNINSILYALKKTENISFSTLLKLC